MILRSPLQAAAWDYKDPHRLDDLLLTFGKHDKRDQSSGREVSHKMDASSQLITLAEGSSGHLASKGKMREQLRATAPDVLLNELRSCSTRRDLEWGRRIHAKAAATGNDSNLEVVKLLIKMYATSGSMVDARRVFDSVPEADLVTWNALILGYADCGEGHAALDLFCRLKAQGFTPNSATYVAALKGCTSLAMNGEDSTEDGVQRGSGIHSEMGCYVKLYVQNTLVYMYSKCKCMSAARRVFDSIQSPDVVTWTALILGYAENGQGYVALDLFSRMKASGCAPDSVTYVAAVKACTSLAVNAGGSRKDCLKLGMEMHSEIGCRLNHYVRNALVDMYAKCGSMADARCVFDSIQRPDVVSWTALILGYAENGQGHVALDLFSRVQAGGCLPNSATFVAALKACTSLPVTAESLERGRQIHSQVGCHVNHCVHKALIDMYSRCGSMVDARRAFDSIQRPDVASWNALLLGYAENGEGHVALDLFSTMKAGACAPNSATYVAALKACASLAVNAGAGSVKDCLQRGRDIHSQIGCHLNDHVRTTLVDMYAKCGSMSDARRVFDSIRLPDVVSWNALLLGYAQNGEGHVTLDLFSRMKTGGCVPSSVTYIAALKACGLIGALALGRELHSEVCDFTGHVVTSLVDFYARCGSMVEAREVFDSHPRARDVSTWNALLAGYSSFADPVAVFSVFEEMQEKGFRPNAITFVCVLSCCSHAGLAEKAREYFETMQVKYGITPTLVHHASMIDVLGRANHHK